MRSRAGAVVATVIVALGSLIGTAPAGAVTASFDATCVTTGGIHGPMTTHRTFTSTAHAPDSVAPDAFFTVSSDVSYAVPSNASVAASFFDVTGATTEAPAISANPGAPSIHGDLGLSASGPVGSSVTVVLRRFGSFAELASSTVEELCTPDQPVLVARVGVGVPLVSIGDAAVVEGSSGTRALEFAVALSRPAATDVTVAFDTEDGTAVAGTDYVAATGSVKIFAGAVTGIVRARVRGDGTIEPKESLRVRLHDPVGAVLGRGVGTGRIIDDDPEPGPRVSIGDSSIVEGTRGTRSARFVVTLSEPAAQQVHFHYVTVDGSATAGVDYRAQEFDYFIPAGHSSISVPVPVIADTTAEPNRSFTVRLTSSEATVGRANGVGMILDDD